MHDDTYGHFTVSAAVPASREEGPLKPTAVAASLRRTNRQLLNELRGQMLALREQHARFHVLVDSSSSFLPVGSTDRGWPQYGFTGREVEVARLLAEGRRNTAIAATLGISPHTARHHTQRVLAKLGVHSRAEAGAKLRG